MAIELVDDCTELRDEEIEALEAILDNSDDDDDQRTSFICTKSENSCSGQLCIAPDIDDGIDLIIPKAIAAKMDFTSQPREEEQHVIVRLSYLPPITLNFNLPSLYPLEKRPCLTLSSLYLSEAQLFFLYKELQHISRDPDKADEPVLYDLAAFLRDEALPLLGIVKELHPKMSARKQQAQQQLPVIQDCDNVLDLFKSLLAYDQAQQQLVFDRQEHACVMCMEDKPGSECYRLLCGHAYCRECLSGYFESKIGEGAVQRIACPDVECDHVALPNEVQELVNTALFTRYDELLLAKTLATMSDVIYCPRTFCQCPIMHDATAEQVAQCPKCQYVFCTLCQRASHGTNPCALNNLRRVLEEYKCASPEKKAALEKQYGDKLKRSMEEVETLMLLQESSKPCPSCGARISKTSGCNKMICTQCARPFCWLCDASLDVDNPYAHFSSGRCSGQLFQGTDMDPAAPGPWDFEDVEEDPWLAGQLFDDDVILNDEFWEFLEG
eukprot:TRINITY_DN12155_c3_g6_i2.p1 TRINITY_DN12155_c3_g6~~TRINITY_DN12155_c3_g6_i2.p1  ORF type:complete len:497 (+),score=115.29 TRINITY_DN12155_c3_g6_i2:62-1552(+)